MKAKPLYIRKQVLRLVAVLVSVVYIPGIVLTDFVHPWLHASHQTIVHSILNEQDPCHRAIYHGEQESNPSHHNHITTVNEKCSLCDIIFQREHLPVNNPPAINVEYTHAPIATFALTYSFSFSPFSLSRGPPVVV